jgi:hypothetical protein
MDLKPYILILLYNIKLTKLNLYLCPTVHPFKKVIVIDFFLKKMVIVMVYNYN